MCKQSIAHPMNAPAHHRIAHESPCPATQPLDPFGQELLEGDEAAVRLLDCMRVLRHPSGLA